MYQMNTLVRTVDLLAFRVAGVCFLGQRKGYIENEVAVEKASGQALSITNGESHRGTSV